MKQIILLTLAIFTSISNIDCTQHNASLQQIEIKGTIKSMKIEGNQQFIVFEIVDGEDLQVFKLVNNERSQQIYKYAKIDDKLQKRKNVLQITIARAVNMDEVIVRKFDIIRDDLALSLEID